MANIKAKNADGTDIYLSASGAGSDVDPNIPAHSLSGDLPDTAAGDLAAIAAALGGTVTVDGSGVTQPVSGTVTVGSITAGTNNIGDVDVASIAAGTNTIGGTRDAGPAWTVSYGVAGAVFTSADASTAAAVTSAPTAGQKLVITDIIFSVDTAMQVDFEIETAGTVFYTVHAAANQTYQLTPRSPLKLPTADKKLMVDTDAAGNIAVTAFYYSEA